MTEGMDPAPLSSTPAQVADATAQGAGRGPPDVWVPWALHDVLRDEAAAAGGAAEVATVNMSPVIVVVGIGADGMSGLAESVLRGAQRHSDLRLAAAARPTGRFRHRTQTPLAESDAARPCNVCSDDAPPGDIHVVASGDR